MVAEVEDMGAMEEEVAMGEEDMVDMEAVATEAAVEVMEEVVMGDMEEAEVMEAMVAVVVDMEAAVVDTEAAAEVMVVVAEVMAAVMVAAAEVMEAAVEVMVAVAVMVDIMKKVVVVSIIPIITIVMVPREIKATKAITTMRKERKDITTKQAIVVTTATMWKEV